MKVILFHHLFDYFGVFHGIAYHQTEYRRATYTCRNHDVKTISLVQQIRILTEIFVRQWNTDQWTEKSNAAAITGGSPKDIVCGTNNRMDIESGPSFFISHLGNWEKTGRKEDFCTAVGSAVEIMAVRTLENGQ